jgi:beta-galactosidase
MKHSFLVVMVLSGFAWGCAPEAPRPSPVPAEDLSFPEGFLFGTAIAGFQVDMGCPTLAPSECDDPNSDWFAFTKAPVTLEDAYLSGQDPSIVGPGFREIYEDDLDRARGELHNGALRFSIEWSRIFPTPTDGVTGYDALRGLASPDGLSYYHSLLDGLKARGMKAVVTLNHYTLPAWIHDAVGCHLDLAACSPRGWRDRERTVAEIAKYAGFCAREFGEDVDLWVTLNEPFAVLLPGYIFPSPERSNPPAVSFAYGDAKEVFVALVEAHARMYDAVKENDTTDADGDGNNAEVGVVYSMVPAVPADPDNPLDVEGAENVFYLYNTAYLDGVIKGDLDADLSGEPVHRDDLANRMDWVGINYYTRVTVQGTASAFLPELSPRSTFNPLTLRFKEDYPRGLYEMVEHVHGHYGLPAIITENGLDHPAEDEDAGPSFLVRHLAWASRATKDGMDLRGYFFWSLMDNYEWNHGMNMHFGLYAVDPADPQKNRSPRKTAATYGMIAQEGRIPPELTVAYPAPK